MAHQKQQSTIYCSSTMHLLRSQLKKMGWHWSTIARNKPQTKSRPQVLAGERRQDRSDNHIESQMCWKYPKLRPSVKSLRVKMIVTHVAFSTWLDPDESILEGVSSVGSRSDTKTGPNYVTPISPSKLSCRLNSISCCC
jgi:hypothetical protein